jgi:hypothetical protein
MGTVTKLFKNMDIKITFKTTYTKKKTKTMREKRAHTIKVEFTN